MKRLFLIPIVALSLLCSAQTDIDKEWLQKTLEDEAENLIPSEKTALPGPVRIDTVIKVREVVRERTVIQKIPADSAVVAAIQDVDAKVDSLTAYLEFNMHQAADLQTQIENAQSQIDALNHSKLPWIILGVLMLAIIAATALIIKHIRAIAMGETEAPIVNVPAPVVNIPAAEPVVPQLKEIVAANTAALLARVDVLAQKLGTLDDDVRRLQQTKVITEKPANRPTLDAFNRSVQRFATINDHIHGLRKKENKPLIEAAYHRLADDGTLTHEQLLELIRQANISDSDREQFVAAAWDIDNFHKQDRAVIDAWLAAEGDAEVGDFRAGVRMPLGQPFDARYDEDIIGDDLTGQNVHFVHLLGFHFPGNTVRGFRQKSKVD